MLLATSALSDPRQTLRKGWQPPQVRVRVQLFAAVRKGEVVVGQPNHSSSCLEMAHGLAGRPPGAAGVPAGSVPMQHAGAPFRRQRAALDACLLVCVLSLSSVLQPSSSPLSSVSLSPLLLLSSVSLSLPPYLPYFPPLTPSSSPLFFYPSSGPGHPSLGKGPLAGGRGPAAPSSILWPRAMASPTGPLVPKVKGTAGVTSASSQL